MIYLIGFMGSGKSTIGKKLGKLLKVDYVDSDDAIEQKAGNKISKIFQEKGEVGFRLLETEVLSELNASIISTGGGIVETEKNIQIMNKNGIIIYLQTSFQELANRLQDDMSRPLWKKSLAERKKLYERRIEMYKKNAHIIIDTDSKQIDEVTSEIFAAIKNKLP